MEVIGLKLMLMKNLQKDMCALGILVMKKTRKCLKIGREDLCRCMHGSCFTRRLVKVMVGSAKDMYCCINSLFLDLTTFPTQKENHRLNEATSELWKVANVKLKPAAS